MKKFVFATFMAVVVFTLSSCGGARNQFQSMRLVVAGEEEVVVRMVPNYEMGVVTVMHTEGDISNEAEVGNSLFTEFESIATYLKQNRDMAMNDGKEVVVEDPDFEVVLTVSDDDILNFNAEETGQFEQIQSFYLELIELLIAETKV